MMLIGTLSASIGLVISTITGSKPDDINALKTEIEKKNEQIENLVEAKDNLCKNKFLITKMTLWIRSFLKQHWIMMIALLH